MSKRTCIADNTPWVPKRTGPTPKGVPLEDRCTNCNKRRPSCNGQVPCQNCTSRGIQDRCVLKKDLDSPMRITYARGNLFCNRQLPCSKCKLDNRSCTYEKDNGLVKVTHLTKQEKEVVESDDECLVCLTWKRDCHGGRPCYKCVEHGKTCTWIRSGKTRERYTTRSYHIVDYSVQLRDNWENVRIDLRGPQRGSR
jgi:hypothetical protein